MKLLGTFALCMTAVASWLVPASLGRAQETGAAGKPAAGDLGFAAHVHIHSFLVRG